MQRIEIIFMNAIITRTKIEAYLVDSQEKEMSYAQKLP